MLFRIHFILLSLLFTTPAAATFDELKSKTDLTTELELKREVLEDKIGTCQILGIEAGILNITDKWFLELDDTEQGIILILLNTKANYECAKNEQNDYILKLVSYAIYAEDSTKIEYWIQLHRESSSGKRLIERLKKLDQIKLNEFIKSLNPLLPFDLKKTLEKYQGI